MSLDVENFTPLNSLAGGLLIGMAVSVLLLINGKIAGVSGIIFQSLKAQPGKGHWRYAFLAGMVLAPVLWRLFHQLPPITVESDYAVLIVAGLLVGLGTASANGCTSGHGICGLARFSRRSIVATLLFMATAMLVVFVRRHAGWGG